MLLDVLAAPVKKHSQFAAAGLQLQFLSLLIPSPRALWYYKPLLPQEATRILAPATGHSTEHKKQHKEPQALQDAVPDGALYSNRTAVECCSSLLLLS